MGIKDLISDLCRDWSVPRLGVHKGEPCPFMLKCDCVYSSTGKIPENMPLELGDFYRHIESAELFIDADFGQWGLSILSASAAIEKTKRFQGARPVDYKPGDWVIGEFKGDLDLLIINEIDKQVLVALPLDNRNDWDVVCDSLFGFLTLYAANHGAKYWEK